MKKEEARTVCLYDLDHTLARPLLEQCEYPWEALPGIRDLILELGNRLPESEYEKRGETVWVHKTARVFESAYLGENRCATVPSCGAMPWWVRALWWETPQNLKT